MSPSPPQRKDAMHSEEVMQLIADVRKVVAHLHQELWNAHLVVWTDGNVSQRLRLPGLDGDLFVIKPSGVRYHSLRPQDMIVCDLDGNVVYGELSPSSDTAAHAYVYRHMPNVGGVVHTHSTFATMWAMKRKPIPCALTMIADEFGGDIPVGPFAIIGDDSIGRGIVDTLGGGRSRAVLMAGHGPFAIGRDGADAVKAAVLLEEVAKVTHLGTLSGDAQPIESELVDSLWGRYQNVYGQATESDRLLTAVS